MAEGAGEGDSLLLAARELGRVVVASVLEPHAGEQLLGPRAAVLAAELEGDLDVLTGGERGDEVERLEHEPHALAAEGGPLVLAERREVDPVEDDPAGGGTIEPGEQAEERALAASRWPDHGQEAARLQLGEDVLHRSFGPAELLADFLRRGVLVHEAEHAAAIERDDFSPFETMLSVLARPYDDQPEHARYAEAPENGGVGYRTFCGT